jgi:hypothetical protein
MEDDKLTELKSLNPGRELVVYRSVAGEAVFKIPNGAEFDAYRTRHGNDRAKFAEAGKSLLATCRVFPSAADFIALLDRRPMLLEKWVDKLTDAAGGDEVIEVKKV